MRRHYFFLLGAVALLLCANTKQTLALLSSDYLFSVSNATYTPLTSPTTLIAGTNQSIAGNGQFNDSVAVGPTNIGFAFRFDCLAYTQFWVSTSGAVYLGSLGSNSFNNDLANAPRYPVIAPWWDHQHMFNNGGAGNGCNFTPLTGVHYQLSGSAPNRVLTIEFNTQVADVANTFWWAGCGSTMNRYQMRLYEGTNNIEFQYGSLWASSGQQTSATIGIGNGTTNFLSVTPTGGTATVSSAVSNNAIAQHLALIPGGTLYRFSPCYMNVTGTAGLATPSMAPGDSIYKTFSVIYGDEGANTPFTMTMPAGACPTHNYTLSVSGTAAADYRFSASGTQTQAGTIAAGGSVSGTMVFRPSALGIRQAFLTITDNTIGCSTIYYLVASGAPRLGITGNIAQGGTAGMASGDTLLKGKFALSGASQTYTPLTAANISSGGFAAPMVVSYTLTDPSGQYSILPPAASLNSGQTSTPAISFNPLIGSGGPQPATLTVTADGVSRTYVLYASACATTVTGRTGPTDGGTAAANNGDTLFIGLSQIVGNGAVYTPLNVLMNGSTCNGLYTLTITGAAAGDYYFGTPGVLNTARNITPGVTDVPGITFRPLALGVRTATLTIVGNGGFVRVFTLSATGTRRIFFTGNIAQGGTLAMNNGDTLLKGFTLLTGTAQGYTPLTSVNISTMGLAPSATVTYSIVGGSGQYSILPPGTTLGSNQSNTPTITFSPSLASLGPQSATLNITADGQTFSYVLYATAVAPWSEFRVVNPGSNVLNLGSNNKVIPGTKMFLNNHLCSGEGAVNIPLTVMSIGNLPMQITGIQFWELDTTNPGAGPLPLSGYQSNDYIITAAPAVPPMSANTPLNTSTFILQPATQATIYVNFVAQRPGRRYARAFVYTNSRNFSGTDPFGGNTLGLLTFDMFGEGDGGKPVTLGKTKLEPIVFPTVRVGDSLDQVAKIINPGLCSLRIDSRKLALFSGDVNAGQPEFTIQSTFRSAKDANGNFVIPPGGRDSVSIRFKPRHVGGRGAWLWLQTNDSSFNTVGNTEQGAYYWDVFGNGTSNLAIDIAKFPPGVINGTPQDSSVASAILRNTLNGAVTITNIRITGPNATDFTIHPSTPLPTLPKLLTPTESLDLLISFKPANNSTPGMRTAYLTVTLETGEVISAVLSAEAGTRVLNVTPATLFTGVTVSVGGLTRRNAVLFNAGTLPLTITGTRITGADSTVYSITPMVRTVLAGGQTEYLELTFKPVSVGPTVATLEVAGNQSNGLRTVALGARGGVTKGILDPGGISLEVGKGEVNVHENVTKPNTGKSDIKLRR